MSIFHGTRKGRALAAESIKMNEHHSNHNDVADPARSHKHGVRRGLARALVLFPAVLLLGALSAASAGANSTTSIRYNTTGTPAVGIDVSCTDHYPNSATQGSARIYADI